MKTLERISSAEVFRSVEEMMTSAAGPGEKGG
jgi:hypothetical protein